MNPDTLNIMPNMAAAAILAVVASTLFLVVARVLLRLSRSIRHRSIFAGVLVNGPGHALRRRKSLERDQLRLLVGTLLLMPLVFGAVLLAWPDELSVDITQPRWLAMLAAAGAIVTYLLYRLVTLSRTYAKTRYALSADKAVSYSLERVVKRANSVFHDVDFGDAFAHKVIVGTKGVFALNVVIHPKRWRDRKQHAAARFDGKSVVFPDGTATELIGQTNKRALAVARHLSVELGKKVPVCPVLVLPGWDLACESQPQFPLVNERNLDILTEWTRPDAYLLDEEEEAIHSYLAESCRDRRYRAA